MATIAGVCGYRSMGTAGDAPPAIEARHMAPDRLARLQGVNQLPKKGPGVIRRNAVGLPLKSCREVARCRFCYPCGSPPRLPATSHPSLEHAGPSTIGRVRIFSCISISSETSRMVNQGRSIDVRSACRACARTGSFRSPIRRAPNRAPYDKFGSQRRTAATVGTLNRFPGYSASVVLKSQEFGMLFPRIQR